MLTHTKMPGNACKVEADGKAMPRTLFSGMDWLPDCHDGGLDRYFYNVVRAFGDEGMAGTALVSAAAATSLGGIAVCGMASPGASVFRRWAGVRAMALEAFGRDVDLVNSHFALYTFPWLHHLPQHVRYKCK